MAWLQKIGEVVNNKAAEKDSLTAVNAIFNKYHSAYASGPIKPQQVDVSALGTMLKGRMTAARDSGDGAKYEIYSAALNKLNLLS